jgi:general secretion pathway protein N
MRVGRWVALIVAGLLLYAILLVVFMPAEYLARIVNSQNNDIVLLQPTGSLWEGTAILVGKRGTARRIGQIRWKIYPWRAFGGALVADLDFSGNGIEFRGTLAARPHSYTLQRVTANAPAPTLSQFYPAANLAGLSGQLQFSADALELEHSDIRGGAELTWTDAASRLVPIEKIGTYRLQLTGEGKHVALNVSTVQGVLQIGGKGEWRLFGDGMLRMNGNISPKSPQPALEPILNSIGPLQASGERLFSFETRLPPVNVPTPHTLAGIK